VAIDLQRLLGTRIRDLRLKQGYSQESFADHCGIHRTYQGGIERGERNLTIKTVLVVAKGLGVTMSELLAGIEEELQDGVGVGVSSAQTRFSDSAGSPSSPTSAFIRCQ
jgi:transcriptional regulator with XRE-family HTH domain